MQRCNARKRCLPQSHAVYRHLFRDMSWACVKSMVNLEKSAAKFQKTAAKKPETAAECVQESGVPHE